MERHLEARDLRVRHYHLAFLSNCRFQEDGKRGGTGTKKFMDSAIAAQSVASSHDLRGIDCHAKPTIGVVHDFNL